MPIRIDFKRGEHTGYRRNGAGRLIPDGALTRVLPSDSGASCSSIITIPGQGNQPFGVIVDGIWAGLVLPLAGPIAVPRPNIFGPLPPPEPPPEPPPPEPPPVGTLIGTPANWITQWGRVAPGGKLKLVGDQGDYLVGASYGMDEVRSGEPGAPITVEGGPGVVFRGRGAGQCFWMRDAHDLIYRDIRLTDYAMGDSGAWVLERSSRITHERVLMDHIRKGPNAPNGHNSHGFYIGGGCRELRFIDCGTDGGGLLSGAGMQVYHEPGPVDCLIQGGRYAGAYFGLTAWSDGARNRMIGADLEDNQVPLNLAGAHGWTIA